MKRYWIIVIFASFSPFSLFADITQAKLLIEKQNYVAAITELKQLLNQNPKDQEVMELILSTYIKMGRQKSYILSLDRFITQGYEAPQAFLKQGVQDALANKDYLRMLRFTRWINSQDRDDAENLNFMGLALYYLRDYTTAAATFLLLLALEPNNYLYLANTARNFVALGDRPKARMYYRRALAIQPEFERAQLELEKLRIPPVTEVKPVNTVSTEKSAVPSVSHSEATAVPTSQDSSEVLAPVVTSPSSTQKPKSEENTSDSSKLNKNMAIKEEPQEGQD